jgi:uncharacterized membrane protein
LFTIVFFIIFWRCYRYTISKVLKNVKEKFFLNIIKRHFISIVRKFYAANALFVCYVLREVMVAIKEILMRKISEK